MRVLGRLAVVVAAALLCSASLPAEAQQLDPDSERAQVLFEQGAAFYASHDYAAALDKMEAARKLKPLPAFDYNIARCHDRLGHTREALDAYERFLASGQADPATGAESQDRAAILRPRLAEEEASRTRSRSWIAPGVMAGVTVALFAIGGGLAGHAAAEYDPLMQRYGNEGNSVGVVSAADTYKAQETAGFVLIGLGAAAAVIDVALFVVASRRRHREIARR